MKKPICIALTFMLISSSFFSCSKHESNTSSDIVAAESTAVSEQTSNETVTSSEESDMSDEMFAPEYETPVSIGKPYSGTKADAAYEDTFGTELTDGLYAEDDKGYGDPKWSNYGRPDPVTFTIDLGENCERLYKFEVSYYHELGPGIGAPQNITVYGSDDNNEKTSGWNRLCRMSADATAETGAYRISATLDAPVSYRYIRFTMNHYSANLFLDELTVYADVKGDSASFSLEQDVDDSYVNDTYSFTEIAASLKYGEVKRALDPRNIALSKNCRLSRSADSNFPDTSKLTDGKKIGATYESGDWVGFAGSAALDMTVNLGTVATDISRFTLSAHSNPQIGIVLPKYVDFFISDNGKNFTKLGRVYAPTAASSYYYNYILSLPFTVKAKYIRFTVPEQERKMLLIEEIGVFAYREADNKPEATYYAEKTVPVIKTPTYFDSNSPDYNDTVNLISGKTQRIYSYVPLYKSANPHGNTPESSTLMTDGKFAENADYTDPGFFKFGSCHGRDVVYDLGATATVTGFSVSFLRQDNVGINVVSGALLWLSEDGDNWYPVDSATLPSSQPTEILRGTFELDKPYRARYARFSFKVWPNAYCDELEVFGTKKVDSASAPLSESGKKPSKLNINSYTERNDTLLGGAKDIVLVPNYCAEDEKQGKKVGYTAEELMPYVAYLDENGNVKDTMFDGFLFCPTGSLLDGNQAYKNANMRETKDQTDKLFGAGRDLAALEEAVGRVKKQLGNDDYRVSFYFTLFYPGDNIAFGDINGDGKTETLNTPEMRIAAIKWAIDDFLFRLDGMKLDNVKFAGFYWINESATDNANDAYIINSVADYCHEKGYGLFWIPFFTAYGFDQWQYFGFDAACMQPNYAFDARVSDSQVRACAEMAKRLGMCVEMEITGAALTDSVFFDKYMEYLTGGVRYGYMKDTIHMYYQDIYLYYNSCMSTDPKARLIYDYTYGFIKGTLPMTPDAPEDMSFDVTASKKFSARVSDGNTIGEYITDVSPSHGVLTLSPDGTFAYYPEKGYTGQDSFFVTYSNYLGESTPFEVTLNIS